MDNILKPKSKNEIYDSFESVSPEDLLFLSAEYGDIKGIKNAIENGVNVHCYDEVALEIAVYNDQIEVVEFLLKYNHPNLSNNKIRRGLGYLDAFNFSCLLRKSEICRLLLETEPGILNESNTILLIIETADKGYSEVVKLLIEFGVFGRQENREYKLQLNNCLKRAIERRDIEIIKLLLSIGADPD